MGETPRANSFEELTRVTQLVVKDFLDLYDHVYVYGSRSLGGWRYCSDFDLAIPEKDFQHMKNLSKSKSMEFGVLIELRQSFFFENNIETKLRLPALRITKENIHGC